MILKWRWGKGCRRRWLIKKGKVYVKGDVKWKGCRRRRGNVERKKGPKSICRRGIEFRMGIGI